MAHSRVLKLIYTLIILGVIGTAQAQQAPSERIVAGDTVPRLIQFTGILKDATGHAVVGAASVTFAIYAEQEGGAAIWSETQNVLADQAGHYSAVLGAATTGGFPAELFGTGESRWLGVTVARQTEMPRALLASVPYALKAGDAQTLGGLPASSYVTTQQLAARNTALNGTTVIAAPAVVGGTPTMNADAASAALGGTSQSVTQAAVTGTGTANFLPLWTSGSNLGVSKVYQANGGFVGINTTTPLLQLDVNGNSIFRGSFQMAPQGTATASAGQPSHSFQWQGSVFNSSTHAAQNEAFGFRTVPDVNDTSAPSTKLDLFYGPGGGTLNDLGLSINHLGEISFVPNQKFAGAAATFNTLNLNPSGGFVTPALSIEGVGYLGSYGTADSTYVGPGAGGGAVETSSASADTAVGYQALFSVTSGQANSAFGYQAMEFDAAGSFNTGAGFWALQQNTTGTYNTGIGYGALTRNNGIENTGVGSFAGNIITTGSFNTFLGYMASATSGTVSNATAIGANATVAESNAIVLGAGGANAVEVGIGTQAPGFELEVDDTDVGNGPVGVFTSIVGRSAISGNSSATSGTGSNGGYFFSASPNGSGVVGINTVGGYAGFFNGNVAVTGTLTKGSGSFKIDDPIDPAHKYLSHSFVESPDMKNIYDGTVTTDAKGYAVVSMPAWFDALNRDFRYQLTTINSFSRATVSQELKDGKFRIRTTQPHVKVSWQVTGIRQDAWANAHRIPNEEEKPTDEQGMYLHPELFGAGADKQIGASSPAMPMNAKRDNSDRSAANSRKTGDK